MLSLRPSGRTESGSQDLWGPGRHGTRQGQRVASRKEEGLNGIMFGSSRDTYLEERSESLEPFSAIPQNGLFERTKFCKVNLCWQSQTQVSRLRSSLSPEHEKQTKQ